MSNNLPLENIAVELVKLEKEKPMAGGLRSAIDLYEEYIKKVYAAYNAATDSH